MFAKVLSWILITVLVGYIASQVVGIVRNVKERRRAALENKTDEKEVDQSNRK